MQQSPMRAIRILLGAGVVTAVLAVYWPALGFELMGDDFQWVQHARAALHDPILLLADLDSFYRPASTWTLAANFLVWGWQPAGYHATNLLLHAAAGILLALLGERLGLGRAAAWAVGLLWACSPFSSEPAFSVAIRFEDLLLISWLSLGLAWPTSGEHWTRARIAAVIAACAMAAMSKETWVVTPILVAALAWSQERRDPRSIVPVAAPFLAAAVAYSVLYFWVFPSDKSYFEKSLRPLAKVPHQFAAFLHLETLVPTDFPFDWRGVVALLAVTAVFAVGFARRSPGIAVGGALALAPTLPTLFVPFLPIRYTAIPYAGFLLIVTAAVIMAIRRAPPPAARVFAWALATAAGAVLATGIATVRADLADWTPVSRAHAVLLAEARRVVADFPAGRPVAVVRAESSSPLVELVSQPQGQPKVAYIRHDDPYGLVDTAALFEAVRPDDGLRVVRWDDGSTRFRGVGGAVLVHETGEFRWANHDTNDLAAAVAEVRSTGVPVRFISAIPRRAR